MKTLTLIIALMLSFCFTSCAQDTKKAVPDKGILIVYLSRSGNTGAVAALIQKSVGGQLVELELEHPYPKNYQATVDHVANENRTGFLPELKTKIPDIEKYGTVFIGFPTWGMHLPPPVKSFLKQYNLEGKTIIPFNTNGGYGAGSSFETLQQLCPKSTVLKGLSLDGGREKQGKLLLIKGERQKEAEADITRWLSGLDLIKTTKKMKNVLVIGASGSLAKHVIDALQPMQEVHLTLLARNKSRIVNDTTGCTVVQADVRDYDTLKDAVAGQDIVYVNLAGDLDVMSQNIIKAMQETGVKRIIAISSIGIYKTPLAPVLVPYRKLADNIETSGLDYTILRPDWFTDANEVSYAITQKGKPEQGSAISRKSIAAFIATIVDNPELHKNENVGISKPD